MFKKISKIVGSFWKGCEQKPFHGGYLLTGDGNFVATDSRRIVVIRGNEQSLFNEDYCVDVKGNEFDASRYPKWKEVTDISKQVISYEWECDLGEIIVNNKWMDCSEMTTDEVLFKTTMNKKVGTEILKSEVNLGLFNSRYIADILRIWRTINKNRTTTMKVTMKFTTKDGMVVSPCFIETLDKKMLYVLMPLMMNLYRSPLIKKDIVMCPEKESTF